MICSVKLHTTLSILFFAMLSHAQIYPGVTASYQAISFKSKLNDPTSGTGFRMGGFFDMPFPKTKFGARMEVTYSFISGEENQYQSNVHLHYLSLPVSFFYMPHSQLQLFLGPQTSVLLNRQPRTKFTAVNQFERIDFGILAAIEFQFATQWSVALRYCQGLNYNTKSHDLSSASSSPGDNYTNRLNAVMITLNYFIRTDKNTRTSGSAK